MPKLFSRMDDLSWLTPSVSDILDQGAAPPGGNGSIREQMLLLQDKLGELETPARVVNVRPTPSYTLFVAKPDTISDGGKRRTVTTNEIKRSLARIAEENKAWKLGFIPQLQEVPDAVGILLRTGEHSQLSLRRMIVRSAFKDHPSTLAFVVGNTLEQHLLVKDIAEVGNLLVIGGDASKQHFVNSVLLTLLTLNTPGELRLAIAGHHNETYDLFIQTPHALGRLLSHPNDATRLLKGLITELERRQVWFREENVSDIASYNQVLADQGKTPIPRIVLVIDSLSEAAWQNAAHSWEETVHTLLQNHGRAGIHLIFTANALDDMPDTFISELSMYVVTRNAAGDIANEIENFHGSLMQFVDAFMIEPDAVATPLELCTISKAEVEKVIAFWNLVTDQRKRETQKTQVSGKTGVTGALTPPEHTDGRVSDMAVTSPTTEEVQSGAGTMVQDVSGSKVEQAHALAAYLGWIGAGPLQDILLMSPEEAHLTIKRLREVGIIEGGTGKTPRFIRLNSQPPQ